MDDPEVSEAAATLRAFAAETGALRAVVLWDRGEDAAPAVLDVEPGVPVTIEPADGDGPVSLREPDAAAARAIPRIGMVEPLEVDPATGQVRAPFGRLEAIADAVREVCAGFGGRSVLTVQWASLDPAHPFGLSARGDELLILMGEQQYETPDGWPGPAR